jgi:hypothetical protein
MCRNISSSLGEVKKTRNEVELEESWGDLKVAYTTNRDGGTLDQFF